MYFYHYPIIGTESKLPVYLISLGVHDCQPYVRREQEFNFPQIFYCTKGGGILSYDNIKVEIKAGTGYFIPASYPHEYYPSGDVWDNHWIIPGGYGCEQMLTDMGFDKPQVFSLNSTKLLDHFFGNMHDALMSDKLHGNLRASGYLYSFLVELERCKSGTGTCSETNPAIIKCVDYIDNNFRSPITMEQLCRITGVSKQYLCRLFRNTLNVRPMEYIAKRRIQAAKELLTGTKMSIEEIVEQTGFCGSSYFCKLFKRYEGITPTQFRRY